MTRHAVKNARDQIADDLARVEKTGEPVAFEKDGKPVAVLVSAEDFALLQRLREEEEDRLDAEAADAAMAEPGESVPWERVKADFGL